MITKYLLAETPITTTKLYILGAGIALTSFSPINMVSQWPGRDQVIFKIFMAGNLLKSLDFRIGHFIAQANLIAIPYLYTLACYSIYSDPTYGLKVQASKIVHLIRAFNFTAATTPPLENIIVSKPIPLIPPPAPIPSKPVIYSGPIVNPFPQTCGLDEQPIPKPAPYTGPIVNPFIQTCGLDEQPIPTPALYTGPIANPFIETCRLDEQPLTAQSSSLLPILGAAAVAAVVGYVAYRYYQSRKVEPIQKQPEPVPEPVIVPEPIQSVVVVDPPKIEEPKPETDPELKEIDDAVASFTDTTKFLATRYIFSAAQFGKGFLYNLFRSVKYIALTIFSTPLLFTEWGRAYFKSKCVRILPTLRNTLISATGIFIPPLAVKF
jgi:hypothetical protein